MNSCPWLVADLLPHDGRMVLLDAVSELSDETICAQACPPADCLLLDASGQLPSYALIEYMAQAIAAFVGAQQRRRGNSPQIGFLLGTRAFDMQCAQLAPGTALTIHARRLYQEENGLAAFECEVRDGDAIIASATLNVFEPRDIDVFLQQQH